MTKNENLNGMKITFGRSAPFGLAGMVVLVLLIEGLFNSSMNRMGFMELAPASWRYSDQKARQKRGQPEIACFGSSLIKFGVLPSVLEAKTGKTAFNFGLFNGKISSSYYLLKHALASGAKPAAIVIDCHEGPVLGTQAADRPESIGTNLRNWPELLTYGECLELSLAARDQEFFTRTVIAKLLPAFRARFEVRQSIMAALNATPDDTRTAVWGTTRNWNVNQGTMVMPSKEEPAAEAPAPIAEIKPAPADWVHGRLTEYYMTRLLDLAREKHIQVFLVFPPLKPAIVNWQNQVGESWFINRYANSLLKRYPDLVVLDARQSRYKDDAFHDATHLNETGSVAYSSDLGDAIARHLAGQSGSERWCDLPHFRARRHGTPLEDVLESRLAVSPRSATRY